MGEADYFGLVTVTVMVILLLYATFGALFEAKHFHLIHETGLGIILGMLAGFIFHQVNQKALSSISDFNQEFFFYILLPLIIFSGGYNLNKRRFFQNFMYINLFGLGSTIVCFFIIFGLSMAVNNSGWLTYSSTDKIVEFSTFQLMIFSATICATDSVAGLTMIKPDKYPKLFSVVFGEGMVNDAVAIIIFQSVENMKSAGGGIDEFTTTQFFVLIGQFFEVFIVSLLIGATIGLFTTWLFKTFRFLTHSCVLETGIIIYMAMISFAICEILHFSGVISVLVAGILLAHYNFYNISPIGKVSSQVTIQTLSLLCESFIYVYLGVSIWTLGSFDKKEGFKTCWKFVISELIICLVARGVAMAILSGLTILIKGKRKWRLTIYELSIIWFAGLIRGSIAYALIQQVVPEDKANESEVESTQVIQTTILIMVVGTTVILGGLMPFYIKFHLHLQSKSTSQLDSQSIVHELMDEQDIEGESERSKKYRTHFQKLIRRIDDKYIKPFFIYDYVNRKDDINKSKKMAKMNHLESNDDNVGRLTVRHGGAQSIGIAGHPSGELSQSIDVLSRNTGKQQRGSRSISNAGDLQQVMTKVQLTTGFNSKYGGAQKFVFDFDVPVYVDNNDYNGNDSNSQLDKIEENLYESDQQNEQFKENSLAELGEQHRQS